MFGRKAGISQAEFDKRLAEVHERIARDADRHEKFITVCMDDLAREQKKVRAMTEGQNLGLRTSALEYAMRTPGLSNDIDVVAAAKAYEKYLRGEQPVAETTTKD